MGTLLRSHPDLVGGVPCLWTDRLGRVELQELNGCSIVNLPAFEGLVQIVDGKGDVRNGSDNRGHAAMRFESDPLDPVRTRSKPET